jgi:adenine-specific DNA methylase
LLDFLSEGVTETGINHGSVFCDFFSGITAVAVSHLDILF